MSDFVAILKKSGLDTGAGIQMWGVRGVEMRGSNLQAKARE
jgi:hypothetical protein